MQLNYSAYCRLARLDKPAGIWLLLLPCWMGLALAENAGIYLYLLFAIGAVTMRAAGCIINDMADREFDSKVSRTKARPLASGEISMPKAFIFLALLLAIGFLVLIQLPTFSVFIGLCSVPLFIIYPFMKRFTYWPQFFLGLTFNIGILVAYAAASGSMSLSAVVLYIGAIFWTLGYDTIYAHQDKEDDAAIGVKSTAIFLGENSRGAIAVFYAIFLATITIAVSFTQGFGFLSFVMLIICTAHFYWQIFKLDINNPANCMKLFKSNIWAGLAVVATILLAGWGY